MIDIKENRLKDISNTTKNELYKVYDEIPVDIDTFIEDPLYLGSVTNKGKAIYPIWRKALREIFEDPYKYTTIVLTGCIGSGKSTIGCIISMYMLYCLLSIKDPHKFFNIEATQNNIMFIFNNLTLTKAQKGMLGTMVGMCQKSPWFMSRGMLTGEVNKMYIPYKRVRFDIASEEYHVTSTDCFCFCFDEANDVLHNEGNYQNSLAMKILNAANQRIRSRFRSKDRSMFFGKSIIMSSKQSEMAFLEQYTQDQLNKNPESVYVFDHPQWEVIPINLSGKNFYVAYGNKNSKSRILSPDEDVEEAKRQGFKILSVPIEYKQDFDDNLDRALTEVAGISVAYIDKFFSREYVSKAIDLTRQNPFSTDTLIIGLRDNQEYKDYFNQDLIPKPWLSESIYIHIDTSINKDKTGITAVSQSRKNPEELHHIFSVDIEAPKNDQICFKKHEDFIMYLYKDLNWNIKGISTDGFNSAQLRQNFELYGLDSSYISPDRTTLPYLSLQRMLYDGFLKILNIPLLEKELVELNMDNKNKKIDHPITGSKDMSDSLACAVQNAINNRSVDDVLNNEYTVDDLAHSFSSEISNNNIIKSSIKTIATTTDQNNVVQQPPQKETKPTTVIKKQNDSNNSWFDGFDYNKIYDEQTEDNSDVMEYFKF